MENQENATDSRKAALSPKQTLALPYIAATASLALPRTRQRSEARGEGVAVAAPCYAYAEWPIRSAQAREWGGRRCFPSSRTND